MSLTLVRVSRVKFTIKLGFSVSFIVSRVKVKVSVWLFLGLTGLRLRLKLKLALVFVLE
jgi:hypothetical protein